MGKKNGMMYVLGRIDGYEAAGKPSCLVCLDEIFGDRYGVYDISLHKNGEDRTYILYKYLGNNSKTTMTMATANAKFPKDRIADIFLNVLALDRKDII